MPNLLVNDEIEKINMSITTLKTAINSKRRDYILECSKNFEIIIKHFMTERLNNTIRDLLKGKHVDQIK